MSLQIEQPLVGNEVKTNGLDQPKVQPPQPAPRRMNSQPSTTSEPLAQKSQQEVLRNGTAASQPIQPTNSKNPPPATAAPPRSSSTEGDNDAQVLPRPITNEEFQAMIPAHFLNKSPTPTNETPTQTVSVTIRKPDPPIELPPSPTGPGRVTETITKSTFTETVVTRITDNQFVVPVIIEV